MTSFRLRLRLASPLLTAAIASLLTACGGGAGDADADFARATPAQRILAVQLADDRGIAGLVFATAQLAEGGSEGGCPAITRIGDQITIRGGCGSDLGRYEGSAVVKGQEDQLREAVWNDFAIIRGGKVTRLDGSASVDRRGSTGAIAGDVTGEIDGERFDLDTHLTKSAASIWTAMPGSRITLDSLGGADIAGAWHSRHDFAGSGTFELRGANTLAVDFGSRANGCYAATVDGAAVPPLCLDP